MFQLYKLSSCDHLIFTCLCSRLSWFHIDVLSHLKGSNMACNSFHAALSVATLASSADFMAWSCVPPWVTSWADCNCQGDDCKTFWRFCHVILSFFIFLFSSKIRTGQKIHWCQPPQVPRSYQYQQQKTPVSMTLRHACLGVHVRMVFFLQFRCANSSLHLGGSSEASWKISFTLKKPQTRARLTEFQHQMLPVQFSPQPHRTFQKNL